MYNKYDIFLGFLIEDKLEDIKSISNKKIDILESKAKKEPKYNFTEKRIIRILEKEDVIEIIIGSF